MDWTDYTQSGIGAIIGSALTIVGFRSRITNIEQRHDELRKETLAMHKEIRKDIKTLIAKSINRRESE